jgi:hypothetical protein
MITLATVDKFRGTDQKGDPPCVRYWEDHWCEHCGKITEFKRDYNWDMVCQQCGEMGYADPLKQFYSKEYVSTSMRRQLRQQFQDRVKQFTETFLNFEGGDEQKYVNSCGKEKVWTFKRFSGGHFYKDETEKDHNKYLNRAVSNFHEFGVKIWMWEDCAQGQSSEYIKYWRDLIAAQQKSEDEFNAFMNIVLRTGMIDHIGISFGRGVSFDLREPGYIQTTYDMHPIKSKTFPFPPIEPEGDAE